MIIQCEQCRTKFKLDDSKVTEKGIKVRCAKCKHIFKVRKEDEPQGSAKQFGALLDNTISPKTSPVVPPIPPISTSESTISTPSSEFFKDSPQTPVESTSDFDPSSFDFSEPAGVTNPAPSSTDSPLADDFKLSSLVDEKGFASDAEGDDFDFGAVDFGDSLQGDETVVAPPPKFDLSPQPALETGGLDFSDDNMFGEVVAPPVEETETGVIDFQMDDFAASFGVAEPSTTGKEIESALETSTSDAPFSLGEIDFGDELTSVAVQQVNPEELKPGQDALFAPLTEKTTPDFSAFSTDDAASSIPPFSGKSASVADELPPLSISSRRKQGPMTMILSIVGVIVALILAFVGYSALNGDKSKNQQEIGRITIRSVEATFVKNRVVGDLLVIKGEAVNDFATPRAAIQVKALLYGDKGAVLATKNAFCGNILTTEQLAIMPLEKIEAAMANQFGDSLANMEVPPKSAVPFVVVIAKPAIAAKDYGVEPAGSTVAAAK